MKTYWFAALTLVVVGGTTLIAYQNSLEADPLSALRNEMRATTPNPSQLVSVFHQIQQGKLKPSQDGSVRLTGRDALLTKDHRAYVTHNSNHLVAVLFPTWIGKGSNLQGYLYCSRSLGPADISKDSYGDKVIGLNTPGPWSKEIPAHLMEVTIDRQISPGIYHVSRSLD